MQDSLRLGAVRGIPIGMHWSLLVVFGLIVLALSAGQFPLTHPGYPPEAYFAAGAATGAVFFASIVAHELGHALLAQRKGVEVDGITLWLFGGVARFRTQPQHPRDEFQIAVIGPGISVALAAVFAALWGLAGPLGVTGLAQAALAWLALINAALAVFNMIPAAPLDGGRVLRSALWWRSGDAQRATRQAARGGRAFGIMLIVVGVVLVAFGYLGGIWTMLIGWFIITAAKTEETTSWLHGVRVRDVMSPDPVTVPDWFTVRAFLEDYVFAHRFSTFPLRGFDGRVSGLVTLGAVKRVPPERREEVRVREVAVPIEDVPVVDPDDELGEIMGRLHAGRTGGRGLVMRDDELLGIVSPTDVSRIIELGPLRSPSEDAGAPPPHPSTRP